VERLIPLAPRDAHAERAESFRPAALEAMACGGCPYRARGGVPELITHGEDGFLEAVATSRPMPPRVRRTADRRRSALTA